MPPYFDGKGNSLPRRKILLYRYSPKDKTGNLLNCIFEIEYRFMHVSDIVKSKPIEPQAYFLQRSLFVFADLPRIIHKPVSDKFRIYKSVRCLFCIFVVKLYLSGFEGISQYVVSYIRL